MKRKIRIAVITIVILIVAVVMMFVTPGTLKIGTNVYSNTFQDSPESSLRHYYSEIKLEQSVCTAETDKTALFLYFNGKTVNVCKMIKEKGDYCYFGEKIKFKPNSDYMTFNKNATVINDDVYYWDIIYQNRKHQIRDKDFKTFDFTVQIGEETRHLTFAYKIEKYSDEVKNQ